MIRAVIYCRVSTKEQAQNLSLPTQLQGCRDYCARQSFDVAEVFEAGPSFGGSWNSVESKGKIQFVVVYNVTRFARNAYDHAIVQGLPQRLGISLRSVNEPVGDDSVGKLTENVLAAFARFDNDQKAERTKAGMLAALKLGRWTWRAPLGFLNGNTKAGESSLILDPERAPKIARAFELVAGGASIADALRTVTALGLVTRSGLPLTPQTFGAVLRNPIYAGFLSAKGFGVDGVRGDFQAIIPEALYQRVQRALRGGPHRRVAGWTIPTFLCGDLWFAMSVALP